MHGNKIKEKVGQSRRSGLLSTGDAIFQDDNATTHRNDASIVAVEETSEFRIQPPLQASKMADVYPIENV